MEESQRKRILNREENGNFNSGLRLQRASSIKQTLRYIKRKCFWKDLILPVLGWTNNEC